MAKGKYQKWIEKDSLLLIKSWARDGLTDKEISRNIGINYTTLYEWIKKYPEISEAIKEGRKPVTIEIEDTFFMKKLHGYMVTETTKEMIETPDGNTTKRLKETEKYIPPDTTAMIFFLKNRMPEKYSDKPKINENSEGKLSDLIEDLKNDLHAETTGINETLADE